MTKTGVDGLPQATEALRRFPDALTAELRKRGEAMGQEMVTLARSRVPVRSGRLLNGITAHTTDNPAIFELRASARSPKGVDYARFLEFGTEGGDAGHFREITSQAGLFTGDRMNTGRVHPLRKRRRSRRTHGGTDAQPFFFNSAREVVGKHADDLRKTPTKAAKDAGLETGGT